uniref:Protein kinase domain-containing protein n=1 Tax=Macrostomum lignano TaxID=282301 RepID=A0A1I8JPE3_9PLAT
MRPCVRPSEAAQAAAIANRGKCGAAHGCWPATRQFVVGLAPQSVHQCQSCRSHRRRRLPSRLHPQPRGFCSSSAGGSRLRDSRGRAAVAAGPAVTAASSGRVATHSAVGATSDVVRRLCAVADSPGRPASPEAGFTMASELLASCLLLLLSVPFAAAPAAPLLAASVRYWRAAGVAPGGLAAVSENINSTSTIEFCHVLAGKRAHFGANSISRLSRLQLREGRVLLAPAPGRGWRAPAGAHPGAADLLRVRRAQLPPAPSPRPPAAAPSAASFSRLRHHPQQLGAFPAPSSSLAREEAERQQQDEQQRAEHPAVSGRASAALLTICRLTAPRLRSTARSAFSCNLPALHHVALLCSQFTWHCSALSFTPGTAAASCFNCCTALALSFTGTALPLSFAPGTAELLSASPGTALLSASLHAQLGRQLTLALLCLSAHLALLCSQLTWHCMLALQLSPGTALLSASPATALLSASPGTALSPVRLWLGCGVPAPRSRLALALRSGSACPAAAKLELAVFRSGRGPESPSQRPAQKTSVHLPPRPRSVETAAPMMPASLLLPVASRWCCPPCCCSYWLLCCCRRC